MRVSRSRRIWLRRGFSLRPRTNDRLCQVAIRRSRARMSKGLSVTWRQQSYSSAHTLLNGSGRAASSSLPRIWDHNPWSDTTLATNSDNFVSSARRLPTQEPAGPRSLHEVRSTSKRTFQARGTTTDGREYRFLVYQRENLLDRLSYSCGIVYLPPGGPRLTLARYNGPSHQHGDIRYKPHIHRTTEAAISAGRKPEHAAEGTLRYNTLEGALACLIEDFNLSGLRARRDHPSLFNGHQS